MLCGKLNSSCLIKMLPFRVGGGHICGVVKGSRKGRDLIAINRWLVRVADSYGWPLSQATLDDIAALASKLNEPSDGIFDGRRSY